jgi:putative transcriptional regulator
MAMTQENLNGEIVFNIDVMLAKRKMSVTDLAEKVGITLANMSVLKNGKAKAVRVSTLIKLCDALDCSRGICWNTGLMKGDKKGHLNVCQADSTQNEKATDGYGHQNAYVTASGASHRRQSAPRRAYRCFGE